MVRYKIEVDGSVADERAVLPEDDAAARIDAIRSAAEHAQHGHAVAVYRMAAGWGPPTLIYFAPAAGRS
jgi:hypothetical protein